MPEGNEPWWRYTGDKRLALLLLAMVCVGGVLLEGSALLGTKVLSARDLGAPPFGRYVDVSCDSLEREGTFETGQPSYLCSLGDRLLPIVGTRSGDEARVNSSHLTGRLRELRSKNAYGRSDTGYVDFIWSDDVFADPAVAHAYLEVTSLWPGRVLSVLALLVGVAAIALARRWGLGFRGSRGTWRRRTKSA